MWITLGRLFSETKGANAPALRRPLGVDVINKDRLKLIEAIH